MTIEQKNLDIYGDAPIPWERPLAELKAAATESPDDRPPRTFWLATIHPDGRPHVAGVGAMWVDDRFYFTSGPGTRKSRNLAENPHMVITVALDDIDLVVEGIANRITDETTLTRIAALYAAQGWPAKAENGALTAEFSAPSAGRPPWYLYEMQPVTAFGVATAKPYGATRWRFEG